MKYCLILLLLLSTTAYGENCLSIHTNPDAIMQHKRDGTWRFTDTDTPPRFSYSPDVAFNDYLAFARGNIEARNPRADMPCPILGPVYEELIKRGLRSSPLTVADLLAPYELRQKDSKKAILLLHGLTDSPFSFFNLADFFFRRGYTVRTLLLPGHATAPSDLMHTTAEDFRNATNYAIQRSLKDFDSLLIGGYSTGAALALDHLARNQDNDKITGAFLWSPASEPHHKQGWLAKWLDAIPGIDWIDKDADSDFAKYESFPFAAAATAHALMTAIEPQRLSEINLPDIPLFSVISEVDTTIDSKATLRLLSLWHAPKTRRATNKDTLVYYGEADSARAALPEGYRILTPECHHPSCKQILDISHIAIPNSPGHPYYGQHAPYRNCGSYLDDDETYLKCKTGSHNRLGERTEQNLKSPQPLQRLTFNPYFAQLEMEMADFLTQITDSKKPNSRVSGTN